MPIFRVNGKNILFAHVPKCGGTTIEYNLIRLGYRMSFLDVNFYNPGRKNWSLSSPQHISLRYLEQYFHGDFFDFKFTVLRDPVERFVSAFNFNRGAIGWFVSFEQFLTSLEKRVARAGGFVQNTYDNHFTPASQLVPEDCRIYYLEDGLLAVFRALEEEIGLQRIGHVKSKNPGKYAEFEARSKTRKFIKDSIVKPSPRIEDLSSDQVERIRELYGQDYRRFFGRSGAIAHAEL